MIELSRLDDTEIILNSEQIESIEQTPDTVITLSNGKKIVVRNAAKDVIRKIINFRCNPLESKLKGSAKLKTVVGM